MNSISDVSFIVITRNEEFAIKKCLNSIIRLSLDDSEIICVDSGSGDSTLDVIKGFKGKIQNLHLLQIEGYANAAIARNAGISKASKTYIYFIDGDVEVNEDFILTAIKTIEAGEADAVVGQLAECQYEHSFGKLIKSVADRYDIKKTKRFYSSGGIFLTKRSVVEAVGFFDESLVKSQDYDFTLRLTERFVMLALNIQMGTHHTVPYHESQRLKQMLFSHKYFGRVVMKNIFKNTRGVFDLLYRKNRGICFGFLFYLLTAYGLFMLPNIKVLMLLLGAMILDVAHGFIRTSIIYRMWLHYCAPITVLAGVFHRSNIRQKYQIIAIIF